MLKANIVMNDGSKLHNVNLFRGKNLSDTIINSPKEAEELLEGDRTLFFGGKYVQGGFIPKQVSTYKLFEDDESIKTRLDEFIRKNNTCWDLNDTSEFIMEYRKELLNLLK